MTTQEAAAEGPQALETTTNVASTSNQPQPTGRKALLGWPEEDEQKGHKVLTRCKTGHGPPPAAPVPEAGGCSSEPQGGCHAGPRPASAP